MYVQEHVPEWVEKYSPDIFADTKGSYISMSGGIIPDIVRGCSMRFGNLVVSIQWSEYNYCDHYIGNSLFTFNPNPVYKGQYKKTREAEVAIICHGRYDFYDWGMHPHFIPYDGYDTVRAYATITEIEEIISVCADYSQA